jgi:hypothetical protein
VFHKRPFMKQVCNVLSPQAQAWGGVEFRRAQTGKDIGVTTEKEEVEDMDEGRARRGERATGTANTVYDLSSVLFHSLEGGASYEQYMQDAEEAGDEELIEFFRRVRDEDSMRADEAQRLLAERTPVGAGVEGAAGRPTEGVTGEPPPLEEPRGGAGGALRTEEAPPTRAGEEVPPRTEPAGAPSRREEDDRGLLDRAKDELLGREEEEPRRREGPGMGREESERREPPRGARGDEPLR